MSGRIIRKQSTATIRLMRKMLCAAVCVLWLGVLAGCGADIDPEKSPVLRDVEITAYNEGSVDSQFVEADLIFDRNLSAGKDLMDNMKLTINDQQADIISSATDGEKLKIVIGVTAIEKGNLVIDEEKEGKGYPGILDESGKYRVRTFTVDTLIPGGVSLEDPDDEAGLEAKEDSGADASAGEGSGQPKGIVTKKVTGQWNIRNITWVKLIDDGSIADSRMDVKKETLDGAIAVHGHNFLDTDTTQIAARIAETLELHFGDRYECRSKGDRVTVKRKDGTGSGKLDLVIYTYKDINPAR